MCPFLNNTQKLVALISIEAIGATDENRFLLREDTGLSISVQRVDYPGGYALFNSTLNKEMLRAHYINPQLLEVHILYTNETFEVQLLKNENQLKGCIAIGGMLHKAITIVLKDGIAKYLTCSFEASVVRQKRELAIAA